jgi:hypothetical protein
MHDRGRKQKLHIGSTNIDSQAGGIHVVHSEESSCKKNNSDDGAVDVVPQAIIKGYSDSE